MKTTKTEAKKPEELTLEQLNAVTGGGGWWYYSPHKGPRSPRGNRPK